MSLYYVLFIDLHLFFNCLTTFRHWTFDSSLSLLEGRGSSSQSFHSHSHATFRFPFFALQSLLLYSYRTISQMTSIDEYDANATMPEDDPNGNTNAAPGPNRWGKSHAGAQELQKMYGESEWSSFISYINVTSSKRHTHNKLSVLTVFVFDREREGDKVWIAVKWKRRSEVFGISAAIITFIIQGTLLIT